MLLLAMFLAVGACSDPSPVDTVTAAGSYMLLSVNASTLPALLSESGGVRVEVTAGTLTIEGDGDCSRSISLRTTTGGSSSTSTDGDSCTWARQGSAVFLTWDGGGLSGGTLEEDELALTIDGAIYVFRR